MFMVLAGDLVWNVTKHARNDEQGRSRRTRLLYILVYVCDKLREARFVEMCARVRVWGIGRTIRGYGGTERYAGKRGRRGRKRQEAEEELRRVRAGN